MKNKNFRYMNYLICSFFIWASINIYSQAGVLDEKQELKNEYEIFLKVNHLPLFENLAVDKDSKFSELIAEMKLKIKEDKSDFYQTLANICKERSIDLSKYFPDCMEKNNDGVIKKIHSIAQKGSIDTANIIKHRLISFGISAPVVNQKDEFTIIVEIPRIKELDRAKELITDAGILEFRLISNRPDVIKDVLEGKNPPPGYVLMYEEMANTKVPLLVKKRAELSGIGISSAIIYNNLYKQLEIGLTLDKKATEMFSIVTKENIGRRIAVVYDEKIIMAPVIKDEIKDGVIDINIIDIVTNKTKIFDLANVMSSGCLIVPIEISEVKEIE